MSVEAHIPIDKGMEEQLDLSAEIGRIISEQGRVVGKNEVGLANNVILKELSTEKMAQILAINKRASEIAKISNIDELFSQAKTVIAQQYSRKGYAHGWSTEERLGIFKKRNLLKKPQEEVEQKYHIILAWWDDRMHDGTRYAFAPPSDLISPENDSLYLCIKAICDGRQNTLTIEGTDEKVLKESEWSNSNGIKIAIVEAIKHPEIYESYDHQRQRRFVRNWAKESLEREKERNRLSSSYISDSESKALRDEFNSRINHEHG